MEIRYRPRFQREFAKLPSKIKEKAAQVEKIFRKNPFDSRLKTHKLHGPLVDFHAFSIDHKNRVIFVFVESDIVEFYSVGSHDIYE